MANRRMFSKDIVRSDAFLDLPISSQALYFHLGMEADDRGYINNPKSVIRSIGASLGDLEQLANKRFILVRGESLILIKGWRINNTIQPTRLVETKFIDDLKKLFFDENNSYTEKPTGKPILSLCQQNVDNLSTQDSIGKDSIDKVRLVEDSIVKERKEGKTMINNDKPLFCESCFQKLISKKYLILEDYADKDRYLELFATLLTEYTRKNICISLNYMLFQVCTTRWDHASGKSIPIGIRKDLAIDDKYNYLRASLYNSCETFKDGYDALLDAQEKRWLDIAKALYDHEDSKKSEFTDQ